ncbi:hypothetical protein T459_19404 [Capsicum annuum]|uniref:histidine kinase n=1 Tax=Capsicum annuum TaxID=4072 RepID=A0A2G2Z1J0_CAPAN|nr:hypothetical protein T459_19404 [Capsicum annuum]
MAPFKALYGRRCCFLVGLFKTSEVRLHVAFANQYGPANEGTANCLFLLVVTGGGMGKGKKNVVVIVVVVVVCVLVIGLLVVGFILWRQRKIGLAKKWNTRRLKSNLNSRLDSISGCTAFISYTFDEIKATTKNFSRLNIVVTIGYGNVYKGVLPGGIEVALKRFKNCSVVCEDNNGPCCEHSHQGWNDQIIHNNISTIWYREIDPSTEERNGKHSIIPPNELIDITSISQVPDSIASWHVAVSKYTDSLLLLASLLVWDPSNRTIVSVVGVTTALHSVCQLMKETVEFHSGHIYLTSEEGRLLATSTNSPLLMKKTKGSKLIMAIDSEDPVIRSGAECLQKEYGDC